ncbi:hypothetical protein [Chamaesiphon polymorphus]|uniref:Uncharacterized protein n=1 Tax=Chamaesiphon polymorphus CCALA 037 TaxID=2107692 RepID=A0A2T1G6G9_9CYAN|nr:hypothetical protein [Chamaesiphon polymorphus]PSB52857.1 hypothetical protein C7B77_20050 [Chamaesiphon polymorphus CCALA 037]
MQLQSNPMTIDTYLEHYGYAAIRDDGQNKLVQLKNLKLVQIESSVDNSYIIQELTQGKAGERWEDISIETVIEHIQMLEGGNDTFAKIWHVDDVLSINSTLSRERARLVLTMAMDNHDANIGINWEVLTEYVSQVLEMEAAGII